MKKIIIDNLQKCFTQKKEIQPAIIKEIERNFKMYMLVGGMPSIVDEYVKTNNLQKVFTLQKAIIENYLLDIMKFAENSEKQKIIDTFNSIPAQLAKKNKKFQYVNIKDEKAGERKYSNSLLWLKDAGIINYCYNLSEPALPLMSNIQLNVFKIYMQDIGLLVSMFEEGVGQAIISDNLFINEGSILENVFASILSNKYEKLMYFYRKSKLEIDFILNIGGVVTAVEVKSGDNKQAKSLKTIIEKYKTVTRYMKFEKDTNIYVDDENIEHYPLFMIMFV